MNEKVTLVNLDMSCTDFEERNAFFQRREQIQKVKTTKECFDIVPIYRKIEGVLMKLLKFNVLQMWKCEFYFQTDFTRFSKNGTTLLVRCRKVQNNFEKLLSTLKKFLITNHPLLAMSLGKSETRKSIDLLLSINQLCSSKRGVSASAPLFMNF